MAIKVWLGTFSDNFSAVGHEANWSDGALPVNNDTLILNDQATNSIGSGLATVLTGIKLYATRGWEKNVGSSGNFLTFASMAEFLHNGRGMDLYLDAGTTGLSFGQVDTDSQSETACVLKGKLAIGNGRLVINSGRVQFNGTTTLESGGATFVTSSGASVDGTKLTIPATGMTNTGHTLYQSGGLVDMSTGIPTCIVDGGRLRLLSSAAIATLLNQRGGVVKYNSNGTLAKCEWRGGTFDASENLRLNGAAFRIITEAHMYDDAQVNLDNGSIALTLTNGIRVFGKNSPKFAKGTKLSIS